MKWVKQPKDELPVTSLCPSEEFEISSSTDFNAPLTEQRNGRECVQEAALADLDAQDAEEAERRLADTADRVIPFKPSR